MQQHTRLQLSLQYCGSSQFNLGYASFLPALKDGDWGPGIVQVSGAVVICLLKFAEYQCSDHH